MNDKQHALAAEIRAEMAARRITATDMQATTGIKHASWRNWFVTCTRPVPYPALESVADVLEIHLSELLRRAEARAQRMPPPDELEDGLSASSRRALAKGRASVRDVADPPRRAKGRMRRSA